MRIATIIAIIFAIFSNAAPAEAKDWIIQPNGLGDAATIQAGIDAASSVPGQDRVVLANGTFSGPGNRDITLNKPITLTSQNGADNAIVDLGGQRGIVITSMSGSPTISNITIENGSYLAGSGAGISITDEDATISGCVIRDCTAEWGGGIFISGASPTIQDNQITGNSTTSNQGGGICVRNGSDALIDGNVIAGNWNDTGYGAGIYAGGSEPTITNNEIYDNDSLLNKGGAIYMEYSSGVYTISGNVIYNNRGIYGGGVLIKGSSGGVVNNNTIVDNWCQNLGGGLLLENSTVTVSNTIIAFNTGGAAVFCFDSAPTIECSLIHNPGSDIAFSCQSQDIVTDDPEFCGSVESRNFELQLDSPAAPAHNACLEQIGAMGVNCSAVPTLLQSFDAHIRKGGSAVVTWRLSEAGENFRFFVYRDDVTSATTTLLDARAIVRDELTFAIQDGSLEPGKTYRYRVEVDDDEDGRRVLFTTDALVVLAPRAQLYASEPNPFNPETRIRYDIGVAGLTRLDVYDAQGRRVAELFEGHRAPGQYEATWNGTSQAGERVASGIYFYRLRTAGFSTSRKVVLLK